MTRQGRGKEGPDPVEPLLDEAEEVLQQDIGRALELVEEALGHVDLPPGLRGRALTIRAAGHFLRGVFDQVLDDLERARQLFAQADDPIGALRTRLTELGIYLRQQRFEEAERLLDEAQPEAERLGDLSLRLSLAESRFLRFAMAEESREAARHGEALERLLREEGDAGRLVRFLNNRSNVWVDLDRFDRAQADLEEASALLRDQEDHPLIYGIHNSLALLALRRGDLPRAFRHAQQGVRPEGFDSLHRDDAAAAQLTLAEVLLELGSPLQAGQAARRGRQILRGVEAPETRASALYLEGKSSAARGAPTAVEDLEAADLAYRRLGLPYAQAHVLAALARELLRVGRLEDCLERAAQALEVFPSGGFHALRMEALSAEALVALGEPAEALARLDRAWEGTEGSLREEPPFSYHVARARALAATGNPAREAWEAAALRVESVRGSLEDPTLKLRWSDARAEPFERLLAMELESPHPDPARVFHAMERGRARTLLDLAIREEGASSPEEPELADRMRSIREEWWWAVSRSEEALTSREGILRSQARIRELTGEAEELLGELGRRPPERRATISRLEELQERIEPDTVLIEYAVSEEGAWALVAGGTKARLVPLPLDQGRAVRLAEGFSFDLESASYPELRQRVERGIGRHLDLMRSLLVDPLGDLSSRAILVPHGTLHTLPLEILLPEGTVCTVLPGASFLPLLASRRSQRPSRGLALGASTKQAPGAAAEAHRVASYHEHAESLLDERATLEGLRRLAPEAGWIHLAGHLEYHPESPWLSGMRLADGLLTPLELETIRLPGSLVVLSACSSGAGVPGRNGEVLAFSRSFLASGASSLLATLWPVRDEAALPFADSFHRGLAAGLSPETATADARRALREAGFGPLDWGAYRLLAPAFVEA